MFLSFVQFFVRVFFWGGREVVGYFLFFFKDTRKGSKPPLCNLQRTDVNWTQLRFRSSRPNRRCFTLSTTLLEDCCTEEQSHFLKAHPAKWLTCSSSFPWSIAQWGNHMPKEFISMQKKPKFKTSMELSFFCCFVNNAYITFHNTWITDNCSVSLGPISPDMIDKCNTVEGDLRLQCNLWPHLIALWP